MDVPRFKGAVIAPWIGAIAVILAAFGLGVALSGTIKSLWAEKPQPVYQCTRYAEYLETKWGLDCGRPSKENCNLQLLSTDMTQTETNRTLCCTMVTLAFMSAQMGMTPEQDMKMVNDLKTFEAKMDAQ